MQSALAFTHSAAVSPVSAPLTPLDGVAIPVLPPRPHLEVYTGSSASCDVPALTPQDDYYVRDMFTPSPTSSSSFTETPLPPYSQEAFMLPTYSSASSSNSQQPELLHGFAQHPGDVPAFGCRILLLLQYVHALHAFL